MQLLILGILPKTLSEEIPQGYFFYFTINILFSTFEIFMIKTINLKKKNSGIQRVRQYKSCKIFLLRVQTN